MKKKFSILKVIAVLSVTSFLGFASHSVLGADGKTIPGTNCVDLNNQNEISYRPEGYMKNLVVDSDDNEAGSNFVVCPIVRDVTRARSNHFKRPVRIQLETFHSTEPGCFLHSRTRKGDAGIIKSTNNGALPNGFSTLKIEQPVKSFHWGTMNIMCNLKVGDRLHGYSYLER